jgi:aminotransferase
VTLAGGVPRRIRTTREGDFKLTPDLLDRAVTPRTRALLFNYPANPTGTTYTRDELDALAGVIRKHDIAVISDEIYHQLSFDHSHTTLSSLPGMRERVILLNGFSKGYAMTGWRVGFACAPARLVEAMTKIHQYAIMCVPTMGQFAALEALKNGEEDVREMKTEYHRRRNFVVHRLNEIGLSCHRPGGTFYVFPKVPDRFVSGMDFANRLLKEKRVAVVPGSAFGEERHIRISYASSMQNLETALKRMESFVNEQDNTKTSAPEKIPSGRKV